jgi:type IV pilus assembly protein PilC
VSFNEWFLKRARVTTRQHRRATLDDKMTFFQQFGSLLASGTPMLQSLRMAAEQNQSDRLKEVLLEAANRVASGSPLHEALSAQGDVFPSNWTAMIGTGEVTGKMDQVLVDLNLQIRESFQARRKFIGSLIYPIVLLVVAVLVVLIMLWFVVPTFGGMFAEMNAELPSITEFVLQASDVVESYGLWSLGFVVGFVLLVRKWLKTEAGLRRATSVGLAIPVVGDLLVQSAMYKFASNMAVLLRSGVPMLEALQACSEVFRAQPAYRDAVLNARNRVAAGRSLGEGLQESGLFTSMMVNAINVGEQSAQLGPVMEQVAPYYREKTEAFLTKVTKLMEPCIIMGMGAIISVVMLAIYIPMFEMAGKVN